MGLEWWELAMGAAVFAALFGSIPKMMQVQRETQCPEHKFIKQTLTRSYRTNQGENKTYPVEAHYICERCGLHRKVKINE